MIRKLLPCISLAAVVLATPRARALDDDEQYWAAAYFQAPVVDKLRLYLEPQYRYVPNEVSNHRLLARGAVYYGLGSGFTAWAGYAWTPVWNKDTAAAPGQRVDEHRPWQQLMHSFERRGGTLVNRLRFEERFIETADEVSFRLRYMARFQYRPKHWHGFGAVVWDELFLNLNAADRGPKSGVDQNRFAVALQYAFNKTFVIEPTYMINGVNARRKDFHTALLVLWITL